jgi:hypothetical protein
MAYGKTPGRFTTEAAGHCRPKYWMPSFATVDGSRQRLQNIKDRADAGAIADLSHDVELLPKPWPA